MLLYVDKKEEKRHKIKIICIILACITFLCANIFHFKTSLNRARQNLTEYQTLKHINTWYNNSDTIILFSTTTENTKKIILLPSLFTKETALTTIYAISKISPEPQTFFITSDIKYVTNLNTLLQSLNLNSTTDAETANILFTSNIKNILNLIQNEKLYPIPLTYTSAKKNLTQPEILALIDNLFPSPMSPQNKLEQEKYALQTFAQDNYIYLQKLLSNNSKVPFSLQDIFLKNVRICFKTNERTLCQTNTHQSLIENIHQISQKFTSTEKAEKLILLTSEEKQSPENNIIINDDDGLHFKFNGHEAFLLPDDIKKLPDKQIANYIIKQQAGINPDYHNDKMKFYKFKTVEVNIE